MYFRPSTTRINSCNGHRGKTSPELNQFSVIPGRTLAVVQVNSTLTQEQNGHLYEIEPNHLMTNEHPNLYIILIIHNAEIYKSDNIPFVVINFSSDTFIFPKERLWD